MHLRTLMACAALLGVPHTSPALAPRLAMTISTNAATGAVTTNLSIDMRQLQPGNERANTPSGFKVWLYGFRLDVEDCALYAVPYVIKNDRQTVVGSGGCLLAVLGITLRAFRKSRRQQVLSSKPSLQTVQSAAESPPVTKQTQAATHSERLPLGRGSVTAGVQNRLA
jgi:hypothetical protein